MSAASAGPSRRVRRAGSDNENVLGRTSKMLKQMPSQGHKSRRLEATLQRSAHRPGPSPSA
eukprot:7879555-Karenia_brevis.AAC.1